MKKPIYNILKILVILLLCEIGILCPFIVKFVYTLIYFILFILISDIILAIFLHNLPNKVAKILLIFICLHSFVNLKYTQIFGTQFIFTYISAASEASDVLSALYPFLSSSDLLFLIALILTFTIKSKYSKKVFILFVALITLLFIPLNIEQTILFGTIQQISCNVKMTGKYIFRELTTSKEKVKQEIEQYSYIKSEVEPIFQDRSLILIQCESFDDFAINELTPNIQYLINNGYYFSNYHAPTYAYHTTDSEFMVLTGQIPSSSTLTNYAYANNQLPSSLAERFSLSGYNTKVYHNWKGSYYNRKTFLSNIGFDELYFAEELGLQTLAINNASDENLFSKIEVNNKDFVFVITCSAHGPFEINNSTNLSYYNLAKQTFPDKTEEELVYQSNIIELDNAVGSLISKYPDAVIIMYSDHVPYTMTASENYPDDIVPLIIYSADLKPQQIDKLCYTGDLNITISELFNLNIPDCAFFGVNVLSNEETTIIQPEDANMMKLGQEMLSCNIYE